MSAQFTESVVEQAALPWLESAGWSLRNGATIAPGEPAAWSAFQQVQAYKAEFESQEAWK